MSFQLLLFSVGALILASLFNPTYISQQNNTIQLATNSSVKYPPIGGGTNCPAPNFTAAVLDPVLAAWHNFLLFFNLTPATISTSQAVCLANSLQSNSPQFAFNPYDANSALGFMALIGVIISVGVVSGINIVSSGLNAGATFILALGTGFILLFSSLLNTAFPTFNSMNFTSAGQSIPIGSTLLVIITLCYTVSSLTILNGVKE